MTVNQKAFINPTRLKEFELEIFFQKTLDCLKEELQLLRNTIYNYDKHQYLFALNERAWVGAFNNAVIKAFPDSAVTLQEFTVYNKSNFVGRADLLIYWKSSNGKPLYLLFEFKQYTEDNQSEKPDDTSLFLNKVREQGQKYFKAEAEYYKYKNVLIIPIAFGWLKKPENLKVAKSYFDGANKNDNSIDFCYLYFEGDYGAWVYGNIHRADK